MNPPLPFISLRVCHPRRWGDPARFAGFAETQNRFPRERGKLTKSFSRLTPTFCRLPDCRGGLFDYFGSFPNRGGSLPHRFRNFPKRGGGLHHHHVFNFRFALAKRVPAGLPKKRPGLSARPDGWTKPARMAKPAFGLAWKRLGPVAFPSLASTGRWVRALPRSRRIRRPSRCSGLR